MEDSKTYGVTMLVTPPTTPPSCLAELTPVAHTTEAGQQVYYKAEQVENLVARLTTPPTDEALVALEALHANAVYGSWYARGNKVFVDYGDNTYCVLEEGEISGGDHPGTTAAFTAAIKNALPGLLARLGMQNELLASMRDTKRALCERLEQAAKALEGYEQWEANVIKEDAAWSTPAAHPWQTDELYDEWMRLQGLRNAVLRPTVKGGQQGA
jgi:hypothetical protein